MKNTLRFSRLATTAAAAVTLAATAAAAHAGTDDNKATKDVIQRAPATSRFYLSLSAGGEFDIHATKFISNGIGDVGVPGAFSLPIRVQSRDFTAVHAPGVINGVLEGGYKINNLFTVFAGFTYSHGDGDTHGAGSVTDPGGVFGAPGGIYEVKVRVSDYKAYTGRAGVKLTMPRYILNLIHAPRAITSYASASAGGKYLEASHAQFTAGNFLDQRVGLYDSGWVFTGQVNLGYDIALTRNASIVFESGYGYDTKPERSSSRLTGVAGVNDGGDRLYSTVSLGAKVKF